MNQTETRNLRVVGPGDASIERRDPVDQQTLASASEIVEAVRSGGTAALRRYAERFDGLEPGQALVKNRIELERCAQDVDAPVIGLLQRTAGRIEAFASEQRDSLRALEVEIEGGRAGHTIEPVARAGCYAPGGRYPLPSSVLMTAVTARVAGCEAVVVATPSDDPVMDAAAYVAGADYVLRAGGAQAIAAMAYGFEELGACDVVVGPGNAYVTAAKKLVAGTVGIDMLAGPSELVVLADASADPAVVASDLLAQAEHDPMAVPVLVTTEEGLAADVETEIERQLDTLPTAGTARAALANGCACVCDSIAEAIEVVDRLAPEHLEIITLHAVDVAARVRNAGGVFIGAQSAEVFGDYGLGPNHTLPTGGTSRHSAGLSVFHFLRPRTWMRLDGRRAPESAIADVAALARLERLEAHARAAEIRAR